MCTCLKNKLKKHNHMFTSNECPLDPDSVTTNEREQLHTSTTLSLLTQKKFVYHTFRKQGVERRVIS